jgi:hypothetical protein
VKIYFHYIFKCLFFVLNCYFFVLFAIDILFFNNIIKLTKFIKLTQTNYLNIIYFFCLFLFYFWHTIKTKLTAALVFSAQITRWLNGLGLNPKNLTSTILITEP